MKEVPGLHQPHFMRNGEAGSKWRGQKPNMA